MGEAGFRYGMTPPQLKEIRRLEKENKTLKELLAEKELEGRLIDKALKKKYAWARNDNGPQFDFKIIRAFFMENHLNQVFTHPYTPQENGYVESFHSILSSALGNQGYWDMWEDVNITREVLKNKKVKFRQNIPYQQLSGNMNLRKVPCSHSKPLDGVEDEYQNEMIGAIHFYNHRFNNHRRLFPVDRIL